ncbi:MAG TPA: hypothetical protein PLL69_04085 [Gemmatimonadales bacterium]|nr:hypothetical protein [Gemmatimonadales bacterium]
MISGGIVDPVAAVADSMGEEPRQGGPRAEELLDSLTTLMRGLTGTSDPLESYILATGGSTGPVAMMFALNSSGRPLRMLPATVVLEPVVMSPSIQARVTGLLQRYLAAGGTGTAIDFYCLEFLRRPPPAGTLLRIAEGPVAAPFAGRGGILGAVSRLQQAGRLSSTLDPAEYLHGVRQWAIWTVEERFDLRRFTDAYLEISRRNLEETGAEWTSDAEREARGLVPGLWNHVRSALREAGVDPAETGQR